ncbi:SGNH hydrolase-type esterase domain-containing protein [Apodospora peruviana]|uniref:SGNH hydrolase-type esterase domain-containing protein n=1 Tax=Apodospora peruviana TaxID=516989 RepID=A0AAE0LZ29_9PEZI|nr:SGNH hydrolase-type esterase domain-containing protein [Apodospora peruviana]
MGVFNFLPFSMKSKSNPLYLAVGALLLRQSTAYPQPKPSQQSPHHHGAIQARNPGDHEWWPIKKDRTYIAFGDSYAAGMGAGDTEYWTSACRRGENNFGNQLNLEAKNYHGIGHKFDHGYCSGDTTIGANRQLDEWKNQKDATLVTLSVGGNDLNFAKIAEHCIITPDGAQKSKDECPKFLAAADDAVKATGEGSLREKFKSIYKRVFELGSDDVQLYVTGYPTFFNEKTDWCDKVTFYFWDPKHYDNPEDCKDNKCVFLTKDLRKTLNDKQRALNSLIEAVVKEVNDDLKFEKPRAFFVNTDAVFEGKRWCEQGVEEPADQNVNEWFFLSSWPDVLWKRPPRPGQPHEKRQDAETGMEGEIQNLEANEQSHRDEVLVPEACTTGVVAAGQVLRDPKDDGEGMRDWVCMAQAHKDDFDASHVHSWLPNSWTKTFHPRSIGQSAIMLAIIKKFDEANNNGNNPGSGEAKFGKFSERCKDWSIKDDHLVVATCTDKDGNEKKTQEDMNLCLHYDNGGLNPLEDGQFGKDCESCFFNEPFKGSTPAMLSKLWCICKNGNDPMSKNPFADLDIALRIQDDGFMNCLGHISAPA